MLFRSALPILARLVYPLAILGMLALLFARRVAEKLNAIQLQLVDLRRSIDATAAALTTSMKGSIDASARELRGSIDASTTGLAASLADGKRIGEASAAALKGSIEASAADSRRAAQASAADAAELKRGAAAMTTFETKMSTEVKSMQQKLDQLLKKMASPPSMKPIAPPKIDPRLIPDIPPDDLPSWVKEVYPDRLYIRPDSALIELVYAQPGEGVLTVIKEGTVVEVGGPPKHTAPGGFGGQLPLGETLVQPFVILGQSVMDTTKRTRLALRAILVMKTDAGLQWRFHDQPPRVLKPGEQYPNYADLQLHHCRTEFAFQGRPKANAPVTCTLTFKSGYVAGNKVSYKSQLNAKGQLNVILAPDFVTLCEVQGEDGIQHSEQPKKPPPKPFEDITVPEPTVIDPNALSALPNYCKDRTVFMCDISGSMGEHRSKLHTGLKERIEDYCSAGKDFVIVPWGSRFHFPHRERWLKPSEKQSLLSWVNTVDCNEGTNMRQAFEGVANSSMKDEIRYIIMMCDGDVNIDEAYLAQLKNRIPNLQHVGFAAFGDAAREGTSSFARMKALAASTGGGFYQLGTQ